MDPTTVKSPFRNNPKPINVFYVWYTELCRRLNCTPTPIVKPAKPKSKTVLDFVADRLKLEEWHPIVSALRFDTSLHVIRIRSRVSKCQFLYDVDTEEKAKQMKRKFGTIWTDFILKSLVKSLSTSVKATEVLTCLELDGLPMFPQYLEPLLQSLKKNKTIKQLSFANSPVNDDGCNLICSYVRFAPNVEILNLTGCGLTALSGEHLAKMVKTQQINRYCESWHNSLRYENPHSDAMRGIKRVTLNSNPSFGDEGLRQLIDELEDDLWIKAVDVQKCGITDNLGDRILQVVQTNKSLEILDLRQNELLDITVLDKILQVLRERQCEQSGEYQWCNTVLSLTWNSVHDSNSKSSFNSIHKSQSAPVKTVSTFSNAEVRKSKTVTNIKKVVATQSSPQCNSKIVELSSKLKSEVQKRKEVEKKNKELQQNLDKIKEVGKKKQQQQEKPKLPKTIVSTVKSTGKKTTSKKPSKKPEETNGYKNGHTNGYQNGLSSVILNNACKIFENLISQSERTQETEESTDNLLDYFLQNSTATLTKENESTSNYSGSQISLFNFMTELKKDSGAVSNGSTYPPYPLRNTRR